MAKKPFAASQFGEYAKVNHGWFTRGDLQDPVSCLLRPVGES